MLYSVSEISELIKLSKVSIYKKLKLKELEPYISKFQGVTYIDEVGFNLLRESLKPNDEVKNNLNAENPNIEIATDTESLNDNLTSLNPLKDDYIETLKKQLDEKDKQIEQLHKLIENNQVLLKQEKETSQLQLEEHIKEIDLKLSDVKETLKKRKENSQDKGKRFFRNIFK